MELTISNNKKNLLFFQKKRFLTFRKKETPKEKKTDREKETGKIPYVSENGTFLCFKKRKP